MFKKIKKIFFGSPKPKPYVKPPKKERVYEKICSNTYELKSHPDYPEYGDIKFTLQGDANTKTFKVIDGYCPDLMFIYSAALLLWKETDLMAYKFPVHWWGSHNLYLTSGWKIEPDNIMMDEVLINPRIFTTEEDW